MKITTVLTLAVLTTALLAAPAHASGTYTVHSCQTPSGTWVGTEGWSADRDPAEAGRDGGTIRACTHSEPAVTLQFGASGLPVSSGRMVRFTLAAPPNTWITSVVASRSFNLAWMFIAGVADQPYAFQFWHGRDDKERLIDFQAPTGRGAKLERELQGQVERRGARFDSVSLGLACWSLVGSLGCGGYAASVTVPRVTTGLSDPVAPSLEAQPSDSEPVRGVATVRFSASDVGGGVYRSIVVVDGVEVSRQVVDSNGGACADVEPGNGDPYEFAAPQPCRLNVVGAASFDTRALRDGSHTVELRVEDAAGNVTSADSRQIVTRNAPVAADAPALSGDARVGGTLVAGSGRWDGAPTAFDYRWLRCDADGGSCTAIAGASDARYVASAADAYRRLVAEVTAANGSGVTSARTAPSAPIADASGRTSPATGGEAGGDGKGGPGAGGGIANLENPVADQGGHAGNGSNASAGAKLTAAVRLASGRTAARARGKRSRRWTVVGRLRDEQGRPIEGARVNAVVRLSGRRWAARAIVRTGAGGAFAYALPAGPSREVRFTYFAFADSRSFRSSNVVRIEALAPMTIKVDRRRLTGTRTVTLSGRVRGERIPAGGLLVTLQGYQRGWGWRTFRTVRASRRGTWRTQYRFRSASGRFGFRAIVPRQGSFPFATTTSKGVFVTVS